MQRMALERIQILKKLSGENAPLDIAKPFGPPLITMQTLGPSKFKFVPTGLKYTT